MSSLPCMITFTVEFGYITLLLLLSQADCEMSYEQNTVALKARWRVKDMHEFLNHPNESYKIQVTFWISFGVTVEGRLQNTTEIPNQRANYLFMGLFQLAITSIVVWILVVTLRVIQLLQIISTFANWENSSCICLQHGTPATLLRSKLRTNLFYTERLCTCFIAGW